MSATRHPRHRTSAAPTVRCLHTDEPASARPAAATGADRVQLAPPSASTTRHAGGRPRRRLARVAGWLPRMTRGRALAMLALSLVVLAGGTLAASAAAGTAVAAAPSASTETAPQPVPGSPVDTCPPGSALPVCTLPPVTVTPTTTLPLPSGLPTTTAGTPCVGLQCLPASSTEPTLPSAGGGDSTDAQCSVFDPSTWGVCINTVMTSFFRTTVSAALNPLLDLLGHTLLTTPTPDSIPGLGDLWSSSWQILLAVYGLIVLIAGVVVMAYESLQARYTIKEIAPRLVVGVVAGALSMVVATTGIQLANALSIAVMGDGVDVNSAAEALKENYLASLASQGFFEIVLDLVFAGAVVAVLLTFIVRVTLTILLIAGAPLFLMAHGLPHTEGIAYTWWKAFGGCLAIQVGQSLALITGVRLLLTPAFTPLGPNASALTNILVGLALMFILFKIPFWILGAVRGGGAGRRGLVSSLLRGVVAYKTFGLLGGRGNGRRRARPDGPTPAPDPYARVATTSTGQYVLPLAGLKRARAPKPPHAQYPAHGATSPFGPRRAPTGVQLALPLGDDWPENKPVLGRDGQYRLPLNVQRVTPTPAPAAPGQPGSGGGRRRGQQLQFEFDPYRRNRPTSSGQYPLPLGVTRTPRPASPPPPATPPRPRPSGTQLELPFDPYKGNRPTRSGQYSLPLEGVHRVPPATPAPPPPAALPRPAARGGRQLRLPLDLPKPPKPTSGGKP
jgi:hypothetical protein